VEFCQCGKVLLLRAPSVCHAPPRCPADPQAEQSTGKFFSSVTHGSECHSERLHPLFNGQTEWIVGGQTVNYFGVRLSQNVFVFGSNNFSVGSLERWMVLVRVSQCLNVRQTDDHSNRNLLMLFVCSALQ
jgi:hypothetical protein